MVLVEINDGFYIGAACDVFSEFFVSQVLTSLVRGIFGKDNADIILDVIVDCVHRVKFFCQSLPYIVKLFLGGNGELFQIKLCKLAADDVEKACDQETEYDKVGQKITQARTARSLARVGFSEFHSALLLNTLYLVEYAVIFEMVSGRILFWILL